MIGNRLFRNLFKKFRTHFRAEFLGIIQTRQIEFLRKNRGGNRHGACKRTAPRLVHARDKDVPARRRRTLIRIHRGKTFPLQAHTLIAAQESSDGRSRIRAARH